MSRRTGGPAGPRQTTRRPAARTVLVLVAVVTLLLSGCTPPGLPEPLRPSQGTSVPDRAGPAAQITVGIDGGITGFNPYLTADYSPASRAVASLVLPSVAVVAEDGSMQLDQRVVRSAEVTSTDPFTVTYHINRDAAWSDGTPVTAEDFRYLHRQLISTAGARDVAAYRAIDEIRSTEAGKTVEVVFDAAVDDWRVMFSPLLPSHILKDAPGGFAAALADGIPAAAGPYRVESVDRTTGVITLARNDKYWADQPGHAQVLLRIGTGDELVAALDRGDVQAVLVRPGNAAAEQLEQAVPPERRTRVPMPATVQLIFSTQNGPAAEPQVRRAVAAGLTQDVLTDVLTGSRPDNLLPVDSMVRLPAQHVRGAGGSPAAMGDPGAAASELAAAGYDQTGLYARRDGAPLRMTLAFPTGDRRLAMTAKTIQQQLGGIGIEVDLLVDVPDGVVQRIAAGEADMALLTVPRSWSDAVTAASQFRCPSAELGRGANLSGYCSDQVDQVLTTALSARSAGQGGAWGPDGAALDVLRTALWSDLPVLPLGEPSAVFAVAPGLSGQLGGTRASPWQDPLSDIGSWPEP